ncbi:ThrRS/AlaRS common domain-containing protein [Heliocybe sulcata]|uniref:ThrRS/AlaRS common domain-containing protein n=1 Tax=Heliocybe sulcata TaxID=5364 RepID=A0A5C3MU96_9AGAM|nr:ThrRS/AlaRS common domain-containing protein [Heliocybe sulcata]
MAAIAILAPPVTPPDYHRIVSPTLRIPTDSSKPIPVGLLACQRDPLLWELPTTVVSARVSQPVSGPSKAKKKASASNVTPAEPLIEVILHDTVLFPEGGGQPSDVGIITSEDGSTWDVVEVKRHGGHAVHYIRAKSTDADAALSAFPAGAKVGVALGEEGWTRRLDHMSLHTSQHLLSAVLETHLKLPTLSWSLPAYPSTNPGSVELPRALTASELAYVQTLANQHAFEGRKVHVEVSELLDGEHAKLQDVEKIESGRAVGKGVPKDYTGGVKRVVVIDGVDRNPCCGTHLPTIHSVPLFLFPPTTSPAPSTSTSSSRLYFLAGPRVLTHLASMNFLVNSTSATLTCGIPLVPARVEQVVDERRKAEKRVGDLEEELAGIIASEMRSETEKSEGAYVVHKHRIDDSTGALAFLSSISTAFMSGETTKPYAVVLSSSPSSQTPNSTSVVFVFGSDDKLVKEVGDSLKAKIGVKGGGKGTRWSGKYTGVWRDKESTVVDEVLKEVSGGL